MTTGTKLISAALVVGLVAVAAAIYFSSTPDAPSASSYNGYEPVVRQWFALSRIDFAKVKHLAGPFYAVRYRSRSSPGKQYCLMVDVSTEYKGSGDSLDRLWWSAGLPGAPERSICDF